MLPSLNLKAKVSPCVSLSVINFFGRKYQLRDVFLQITGENEAGDGPLNTITEAQEDGTAGVSFEDEAADTAPSDAILDEDNQAVPEEVPNGRVVTMLQDMPSQDSQEDNFW